MNISLISFDSETYGAPNYGMWSLKQYMDQKLNVDVNVYQCFSPLELKETVYSCLTSDVIGIQLTIWSEKIVFDILSEIKGLCKCIVVGGPQVKTDNSLLSEMMKRGCINYAFEGYSEENFLRLVSHKLQGNLLQFERYLKGTRVPGDFSPYLPNDKFLTKSSISGNFQIITSSGCAFACTYCGTAGNYNRFSLDVFKNDLSKILSTKIANGQINFLDGTFILQKKRALQILEHLKELPISWSVHAELNAEQLDHDLIEAMKCARFKTVELGLQTCNEKTLKIINRNFFRRTKYIENVQKLIISEISVMVNLIVGLPGETLLDWLKSVDFCYSIGNVVITSSILSIYPGTEMSRVIEEYGYVVSDEKGLIASSNTLSAQDLKKYELYRRLLRIVWNHNSQKEVARLTIEKEYGGKLSNLLITFLKDLMAGKVHTFSTMEIRSVYKLGNDNPRIMESNTTSTAI